MRSGVLNRDIYYIESQGHTLILHTILGDYETTGTMKEMEEKLADHDHLCLSFFHAPDCTVKPL